MAARFVDAVFVNDDPADKAAELDQPMPVAAIACQAGGLDREDRPSEQDLCIAERHSGPWINLRRADEVAIIEANAAVKLVGEQEDVPPDPLGGAVDNFGKSNERFATVNASSRINTSRVRGVMAASFLRSSRSNSSRFAQGELNWTAMAHLLISKTVFFPCAKRPESNSSMGRGR